jgi:hypothetical protein
MKHRYLLSSVTKLILGHATVLLSCNLQWNNRTPVPKSVFWFPEQFEKVISIKTSRTARKKYLQRRWRHRVTSLQVLFTLRNPLEDKLTWEMLDSLSAFFRPPCQCWYHTNKGADEKTMVDLDKAGFVFIFSKRAYWKTTSSYYNKTAVLIFLY